MVAAFAQPTPLARTGRLTPRGSGRLSNPLTPVAPRRATVARPAPHLEVIQKTARLLGQTDLTKFNLTPLLTACTAPTLASASPVELFFTGSVFTAWNQFVHHLIWSGIDRQGLGSYAALIETLAETATAENAAQMAVELVGLRQVSTTTQGALTAYASQGHWSVTRAAGVIHLLLLSPDYLAQAVAD